MKCKNPTTNGTNIVSLPHPNYSPREFKLITLRECPTPERMAHVATPADAAAYWRANIGPTINPDVENLVVIALNTSRRIRGHQVVAIGNEEEVAVCIREVFRAAVVLGAASIITAHNHPSGIAESSPQDREFCDLFDQAGAVLGIEHLDSLIIGNGQFSALKGFDGQRPGQPLAVPAALAIVGGKEPFTELPAEDADVAAWEGWNQIVDFRLAPHPDMWLGPDDRFYLSGSSNRVLHVTLKEALAYIEFATDCEFGGDVTPTRVLTVAGDALPGPRADYRDLLKRAAVTVEETAAV